MKNIVIESLVDNFKSEKKIDDKDDSVVFEHFVNFYLLKRDFLDDFELEDIRTNNSEDNGIDGIALIAQDRLLLDVEDVENISGEIGFVFIQSKKSEKLDAGELLKFFRSVEVFFDKKKVTYPSFREIKDAIYKKSSCLNANPKIYLFFAYCGNYKDSNTEQLVEDYKKKFQKLNIFSEVNIKIIDVVGLQSACREVDLRVEKTICLEKITTLPKIKKIQESYIGLIPLTELIKLVSDSSGRMMRNLFYDNVRGYQGDTKINREIGQTLQDKEEHENFVLFHNGITIVSKVLRRVGDDITLENFQIVNGCQTSHIIYKNKELIKNEGEKNIFVPIKLIATSDNGLINQIIKATNRHNEVKIEAFESLEVFHKDLENYYNAQNQRRKEQIYYERRSKQYIFDEGIKKERIVSLAQQIRTYLSMFCDKPHSTHRYYGELLDSNRKRLFGGGDKNEKHQYKELYYISSLTFFLLEKFFKKNINRQEHENMKYHKNMKYHILLLTRLLITKKNLLKLKKNEYQEEVETFLKFLDDQKKIFSIFNQAITIIEKIKDRGFEKRTIHRTKEVTEQLIQMAKTC